MKILIVGGVAGGATAAARLRRLFEDAQIVMFEKDEYISYANCGLPYYIGDVIKDKQKLQVQTVAGFSKRFNVDVRTKNEVTAVDRKNNEVTVKDLNTGKVYKESYDKLILSCGAKPVKPNIAGLSESDNVFVLRNIPDTYKIKDYIVNKGVKKAVVIGGGFIGVEMAENLKESGIDVTIVEKLPQVLRQLDYEMAQLVHQELSVNGVGLILGDGISAFADKGKTVVTENGNKIATDMTVLAIGVTPENTLAKGAGIKLGARGHVEVTDNFNVYDETGSVDDNVFAIGDMIEVTNALDGSEYAVPLAWGANRQGRIVADYISGKKIKKSTIAGASVLKVFDLIVASTGANETTLKQKNIGFTAIHAHRANHAGYYPNSSNIALKMLYDEKTGKIFGAQAVGREGTEKRIDVLSTVMRLNGTAYDLSDLELCYAPPFSSAKDPVNILGYIAEDIADGVYKTIHHDQIDEIVSKGGLLLDVRTPLEYDNGHIEGSVNLELDQLRNNIDKLPKSKEAPLYVTCQVGQRAYYGIRVLRGLGYNNIYNLTGGYATYKAYKYKPTVTVIENKDGGDTQMVNNIKEIDVTGLQCPGPLMATYKALNETAVGDTLKVIATDSGFGADIENWCKTNGHTLLEMKAEKGKYIATVQKGGKEKNNVSGNCDQKNASIVVFSGNLDKVLASMIIAQGAAAQGKDVTMFFTFWGLNALRKDNKVKVKKNAIEKMFGAMMPRGANRLPLSNMNMAGMGSKMIKGIMKKKHVDSLPEMIVKAQAAGVKMIACTMSMDLMGIKKEELIEGIGYAGVATYISHNENVGTTLFI
ncbi:MAG: DsrE/DsrF/DrsH-like family protein [Clostridia bacterium]|nr:DsrE/DsrF/DrsH-like family protein [Clostridia bacterium]